MVPPWIQETMQDPAFIEQCHAKFDQLDADRNGFLTPDEVFPIILELSLEHPVAVTYEHCARFVDMFDAAGNGKLSREEFQEFVKFVWFMRWLESANETEYLGSNLDASESQAVQETDAGAYRIDEMLDMMQNDRSQVKKNFGRLSVSPMVPEFIQNAMENVTLKAQVFEKFDALDIDKNGVLTPAEVFPIIEELSQEHPFSVTYEHCLRFVEMFDQAKNGVLSKEEFAEFIKFVWFMSWLESQQQPPPEEEGEMRIHEMLDLMQNDRSQVKKHFGRLSASPAVPDFIQNAMENVTLRSQCYEKFDALDIDGNGVLTPGEVFPIIEELSQEHPIAVTYEHCIRFVEMFDKANDGVLSKDEFCEFVKFVWFMRWLESQQQPEAPEEVSPAQEGEIQIHEMLDMMQQDRADMRKHVGRLSCSPVVPPWIQQTFTDPEFIAMCSAKFDVLDRDKNNVLDPSEVFDVILELSQQHEISVTFEHCKRLIELFDQSGSGVMDRDAFLEFVKFVWFMRWLESQESQSAEEQIIEEELAIHDMLDMVQKDRSAVGRLSSNPVVPSYLQEMFDDPQFKLSCMAKFDALDVNRDESLEAKELVPVVVELSAGNEYAVTIEHCLRLVDIFDTARNGVLSRAEFYEFVKFVWFISWLESQSTMAAADEGEIRVHDMLDIMQSDHKELKRQFGRLSSAQAVPKFIQDALSDQSFIAQCNEKFDSLDVDKNGVLSPDEVFPIVVELSLEQPISITIEHCMRFVETFDTDGKGVLKKEEFCEFVKFVWFMRWLEGQGQGQAPTEDPLLLKEEASADPRTPTAQPQSDLWISSLGLADAPLVPSPPPVPPLASPVELSARNPFRRRTTSRLVRRLDPSQMRSMTPDQLLSHLDGVLRHGNGPPRFCLRDFLHNLPRQWHMDERLVSLMEKGAQSNWSEALDGLLSAIDPIALHSPTMMEASKRALEVAVVSGHAESCEVLLNRGGATLSVQHRSRSGMTLLMLAAWKGHNAVVENLLKQKAKVDARDTGKRTALHFAAVGGHLEAVRLLLAANADPNAADQDGWTPLADAEHNGHKGICEELLAQNAKAENADAMKAFRKLEDALSFSESVHGTPRSWVKPVKDPMRSQVDLLLARKTYSETLEMLM
eukprot:gnl/MRDRNA2_/MRDRNA2_86455_c0_seq5.p1 gnl/MRDRNA2_/MRDRNA2_86455_c0~~gnl/MRDRNA2_/MRDRNA2_86455_c0_seq5.p1  ORF type:complete len:1290 (+),score=317.82 gnl/MRDRNA2_/MRDRNA2_86455_c0_seq5:478-3870(+)